MKNKITLILLFLTLNLFGVSHSHIGSVNEVFMLTNISFFSCGDDGSVVLWQGNKNERLQVSDIPVKKIAYNSSLRYIAVYETDGFSLHRVSVWDWNQKKRLYAKRFTDRIVFLSFSTKGNYLMVGTESINSLNFFDSKTGEQKQLLESPGSLVSFALTGATDTTLATYSSTGSISYYDLKSGEVKHKFSTISDLKKPVIHKNNLLLSGIVDGACITVDMTNGKQVNSLRLPEEDENTSVAIAATAKDVEPTIFIQKGNNLKIKNYSQDLFDITTTDNFKITDVKIKDNYYLISTGDSRIFSMPANQEEPVLALLGENSIIKIMDICELNDGSGNSIVVTEDGIYKLLSPLESPVKLSDNREFEHCVSFLDGYILWNENNLQYTDGLNNSIQLGESPSDITAVSVYDNLISVIDKGSVLSITTNEGTELFDYSGGVGLTGAVFYDKDTIYVSKTSTSESNPPLIKISIKTGEIVPIQQVDGIMLYNLTAPEDNESYGLLVTSQNGAASTELIRFNYSTNKKTSLANYPDENTTAFISVIDDVIYTNLGKTNVIGINRKLNRQVLLDTKNTLPQKLIDGKDYLISLNFDGTISYYSKRTLKQISLFRLGKDLNWQIERN